MPMEKLPQLAAVLDDLVEACRRLIEAGETPPPTLAVATPGQTLLVAIQAPRVALYEALRRLGQQLAALSPLAVGLVADGYYRDLDGNPPSGSLAHDPGAREALVMAITDRRGDTALRVFPYRRQADGTLSWEGEVTLPEGATVEASILRAFWQGVLDVCL
jgi:hypothetical protein